MGEAVLREIRAIYRGTMAEFLAMQARYEEQTVFGNKRGRQVRWQRDLALRLAQQKVARSEEHAAPRRGGGRGHCSFVARRGLGSVNRGSRPCQARRLRGAAAHRPW